MELVETIAEATGGSFLAILITQTFPRVTMFDELLRGRPMDTRYAEIRRYWEPIWKSRK